MTGKILVADDESRMRRLVGDFLKREGYQVIEAGDGEEALDAFYSNRDISLVILDVMMPKYDGFYVLRELRENSSVPVIMLTARSQEEDELKGFGLGVDEYIGKPFSPKILVARVNAVLRRSGTEQEDSLTKGALTLDESRHEVTLAGKPLKLSVKEFDLLRFFMKNSGIALSREKILTGVWEYDYYGDERTVDTHVKMLRGKLKDRSKYIKTIWGMGYKFEAEDE